MTTISQAQQMVHQFHEHCKLLTKAQLTRENSGGMNSMLYETHAALHRQSMQLQEWVGHDRGLRAHLLTEELAEVVEALMKADEKQLLDGLADLLYVVLGTAAIYDLPLEAAFVEVHRSNMTKEKQPDDPHAQRLRSKGPNYRPPNIERVLTNYRSWQREHVFAPDDLYSPYCECGRTQNDSIHITRSMEDSGQ